MHWFDWFNAIVAHVCLSRQHEAPTWELGALLPTKMSVINKTPNRTDKGRCMGGKNFTTHSAPPVVLAGRF